MPTNDCNHFPEYRKPPAVCLKEVVPVVFAFANHPDAARGFAKRITVFL
jgi:hypothetical protein